MTKVTIDDKDMPQLRQALAAESMAAAFDEFFRKEYPARGLKVEACSICRVYHKPGKECNITYRLLGHDGEQRPFDQWFYGHLSPNLGNRIQHLKNQPQEWPGCGFWKPTTIWPEMNMLLQAFPYDSKLPYLGQLLELDFVKPQIEKNLSGFGLSREWKCREVACHKIKYMPGKRCILRYEILLTNAANSLRQIAFYSKTYNSAKSRYVYEVLQKICASPACAGGLLNIPGPIAHIEDANTLWQQAWKGEKFPEMMEEIGWDNFPNTDFPCKIASMLATLHCLALPDLRLNTGPSPYMVLENARGDANDIMQFFPEKQATLEEITRTLETWARRNDANTPQATIHGSFKLAQLLCRNQELGLVDFDSLACGDPHYDVAEFLASLLYLPVSDNVPTQAISRGVESFLASYQKQVPWTCDRRRIAWYVVAFLLGKIHSSLKRFEAPVTENIDSAFALVETWLEWLEK
ncbi:MAG: aminoglycoside phosphotransferase family protein [candidate division KSB1 bacterium]|nr:aminoglycoside phosphotransferase family protein [candidate division KSB1 bacterium]MDZ7302415.1 aminoglycoside phosphotransferase family protein [candidate division KSB1 bacterium]MDZ7311617.1 aminoglycoside phosphotransferase family protein [candidate division KSB1 bacterium]